MNSLITIGNYKNTSYAFSGGTRIVTLSGLDFNIDKSVLKLFANQTQNIMYGAKSYWNGNVTQQNVPITGLTVGTATSSGAVTVGRHIYKYTYVYSSGEESLASAVSNAITIVGGTQTVPLTNIAIGNSNVVARNIYRSIAGTGSTTYYLAQLADNVTTTYSDIIVDGSLGTVEPTVSSAFDIVLANSFPVLQNNDILDIEVEINNSTDDDDLGVVKNINLDSSELPPADSEVSTINDTNLSAGVYFYELPCGPWRNFIGQLKATCGTTPSYIKVYGTLDPSAVVPATNGTPSVDWTDLTAIIFATPVLYVPITGTLTPPIKNWNIDDAGKQILFDRFLLQFTVNSAASFINLNVRKF